MFKIVFLISQGVENNMNKKQVRTIFRFQLKLVRKAAKTAGDINEAIDTGTSNE